MSKLRNSKGQFVGNGELNRLRQEVARLIQLNQMVSNTTAFSRTQLASYTGEGDWRRSINHECGYPETNSLINHYEGLADREVVAARAIEILPKECWKVHPTVYEAEQSKQVTEFEQSWDKVAASLAGETWFAEEEGGQMWNYLERADVVSGVGRYGVLLLGFNDGKPLSEPVEPRDGLELVYMRPYSEFNAPILHKEEDRSNRRFNQPVEYSLKSIGTEDVEVGSVHWSRVIHIADNCSSSDVLGVPRLQRFYNRVYDIRKILGAGAEGYWQSGIQSYSYELPSGVSPVDAVLGMSIDELRDRKEKEINSLQRYELNLGLVKKAIAPSITDPDSLLDWEITMVCIGIPCPKRIFMGSERGELASSQDTRFWNSQLSYRQNRYLTPRVVVPLVNRLISLKVLPVPQQGFRVAWPDIDTLTPKDMADLGLTRAKTVETFVRGDGISVMELMDFWTRIVGLTEEEAQAVIDAKKKAAEDEFTEDGYDEDQGYKEVPNGQDLEG